MDIKLPVSAALGILITGVGSAATTVNYISNTYARAEDVKEIIYLQLKSELRNVRKDLQEASNPKRIADLKEDIEYLLDRICTINPDDRECNEE